MTSSVTLAPGCHVNLNLLQGFVSVAEQRSFNEAARRCGRSPSAISGQIRQLEGQLQVQLLHRTTRSVALTPEGEALLRVARHGLDLLGEGIRGVQRTALRATRSVPVVSSASIASSLLPPVLKRFRLRHPDVEVELAEMRSVEMIDPVLTGRYAFGVTPVIETDAALRFEVLAEDPLIALVPRRWPVASAAQLTLADLREHELLLPHKGGVTRSIIERAAQDAGVTLSEQFEAGHFHTLIAMVRAELGIAILPWSGIYRMDLQDCAVVRLASPMAKRPVALVFPADAVLPPPAAALARLIKEAAAGWNPAGP